MGRPAEYKPEYCEKLIAHMASGMSFDSFGGSVDVSHRTLYNWLEKYDDFLEAKGQGELKGLAQLELIGLKGMTGKIKGFNAISWLFVLKCRFRKYGYRDYKEDEGNPRIADKAEQAAKLIAHLTEMVKDTQCQPVQIYSSPSLVESPPQGLLGASSEPKLTS